MDDIDLDVFADVAVVFTDTFAGEITTTITIGDFRALSANGVLHLLPFDFITANINELEFKRAFSMFVCSFRHLLDALSPKMKRNKAHGPGSVQVPSMSTVNLAYFCEHSQ